MVGHHSLPFDLAVEVGGAACHTACVAHLLLLQVEEVPSLKCCEEKEDACRKGWVVHVEKNDDNTPLLLPVVASLVADVVVVAVVEEEWERVSCAERSCC